MIDLSKFDKEKLWEYLIERMERHGVRFSKMIAEDGKRDKGWKYFDEKPQSWLRFKWECRKLGWGDVIDNLQILEREMLVEHMENELVDAFNSGDIDTVKAAVQAMNGINTRAKISNAGAASTGEGAGGMEDSFDKTVVVELEDEDEDKAA